MESCNPVNPSQNGPQLASVTFTSFDEDIQAALAHIDTLKSQKQVGWLKHRIIEATYDSLGRIDNALVEWLVETK